LVVVGVCGCAAMILFIASIVGIPLITLSLLIALLRGSLVLILHIVVQRPTKLLLDEPVQGVLLIARHKLNFELLLDGGRFQNADASGF